MAGSLTTRTISHFGSASNVSSAAGTAVTCNLPASIPTSAIIILVVSANGNMDITGGGIPTGYTRLKRYALTTGTFPVSTVVFAKYADGSEGSTVGATLSASLDWNTIAAVYQGGTVNDGSPALLEFFVAENAASETYSATDTTLATPSAAYTSSDYGLWRLTYFADCAATGGSWTSTDTERKDVVSSGTASKVTTALYDSNAAISSGTSTTTTGTSAGNIAGNRIAWIGLLRVGKGGTISGENTTPTDSVAKTTNQAESDNVVPTDTTSKSFQQVESDAEAPTDTTQKTRNPSPSDNIVPRDSMAKSFSDIDSDSTGSVDTTAKTSSNVKSDNEPLSDTLTKTRNPIISDSEPLTDSRNTHQTKGRSDNVVPTDSLSKSFIDVEADILAATDTLSKSATNIKLDLANPTDVTSKTVDIARGDIEPLSDTRSTSQSKTLSDSEPISDSSSKSFSDVDSDTSGLVDTRSLGRGFETTDLEPLRDSIFVGPYEQMHIQGSGSGGGGRTHYLDISDGMDLDEIPTEHINTRYETVNDLCHLWDAIDISILGGNVLRMDVTDYLRPLDSMAVNQGRHSLSMTDSLYLLEQIYTSDTNGATHTVESTDLVPLGDTSAVSPVAYQYLTASDRATLTDTLRVNYRSLVLAERPRLSDAVTVSLVRAVTQHSDRVRLSDRVSVELTPPGTAERSIGQSKR